MYSTAEDGQLSSGEVTDRNSLLLRTLLAQVFVYERISDSVLQSGTGDRRLLTDTVTTRLLGIR